MFDNGTGNWQLSVQPVTKISSNGHFRFTVCRRYTCVHLLLLLHLYIHWKPRITMVTTLSSQAALASAMTTTSVSTSNDRLASWDFSWRHQLWETCHVNGFAGCRHPRTVFWYMYFAMWCMRMHLPLYLDTFILCPLLYLHKVLW